MGQEEERESERRVRRGARSHNPKIRTQAETESPTPNQLRHAGALLPFAFLKKEDRVYVQTPVNA